jgi:threonine dehydratase
MKLHLTLQDIYDAESRLAGTVHRTNLYPSTTFSAATGGRVYFKNENMQKTGSFKVRGAYN